MTKQDPLLYMGSGLRWRNHLSLYGNNVDTEILFESEDLEKIKEFGLYYSDLWNVTESREFANLKNEEGDGGFNHINYSPEGDLLPVEERPNIKKIRELISSGNLKVGGKDHWTEESYMKVIAAGKIAFKGRKHSEETKKKVGEKLKILQKGENNSQYGTVWCVKDNAKDCKERKKFKKDSVPPGWITTTQLRENKKKKSSPNYGKKWYNDGKKSFLLNTNDVIIKEKRLKIGRIP